jgi:Ubiquinone biosynthesis protein COQ7
MPNYRKLSLFDEWLIHFDRGLKAMLIPMASKCANPAADVADVVLNKEETRLSSALMRVDHAGEVCAQALYQGQSLTVRVPKTRKMLLKAASEEVDHLIWCENRLSELHSHASYLTVLWYVGSFLMGVGVGLLPCRFNLGFVVETEKQVMKHLEDHLERLPHADLRSRAILTQMHHDEQQHATHAVTSGAALLPHPVAWLMRYVSKVMTTVAYFI